jgi:O-antigen/teichoic acid export membrane protein
LISQRYGQTGLGIYSFAIALTNIFAGLATFGLHAYSIKELNRSSSPGELLGAIVATRFFLCVISFACIWMTTFLLQLDPDLVEVVLVIGIYQLLLTLIEGLLVVYVVQQKMSRAAIVQLAVKAGITIAAAILITTGASLRVVLLAFPLTALLGSLITLRLAAQSFSGFRLSVNIQHLFRILRDSLPFAIVEIARRFASRVDVVLLTILIGVAASGVYNAAYRVVFLMLMAPNFAGWVVMTIVSSSKVDTSSDRNVLAEIYSWSLLIGLPVSAGLYVTAPEIVALLFGSEFSASIKPLRILSWLVLMTCIVSTLIAFLSARDKQHLVMRYQITAAIFSFVSNIILIRYFGIQGAAISAIVVEGALVFALIRTTAKSSGFPIKLITLTAGVAGVSTFFLLRVLLDSIVLYWFIPVCMIIYLTVLCLFPSVRNNELNMLWQWFRTRPEES